MKVAIVTGAYKGLGLAWCKELLKINYKVILTARTLDKASEAAKSIDPGGENVFPHTLDVTNESDLKSLVVYCENAFGKMDLVVNNAGINPKDFENKEKMAKAFQLDFFDPSVMDEVVHANSYAPLLMVKHFRRLMRHSDRPIVINISSWLGSVTNLSFGGHYGYVGSKNFLNVLNKSMALELASENIISVNVNPGWVQTDMGGSKAHFTPDEAVQNILKNVLQKVTINDTGKFLNHDGNEFPW